MQAILVTSRRNPVGALFVWVVRGYQVFISPGLPGRCKYYPSCSQYAIDALTEYGVLRGFVLASWRLLRCNPLSYGGYDPVHRQTLFASRSSQDLAAECVGSHRGGAESAMRRGRGPRDRRTGTA
jgi:putative membrane protein insertion efficiency factor